MLNVDLLWLRMYTTAIWAVISKPNKFTDGMECAICGDKYTFDKCKALLDVTFLQKHSIAYCLQWKGTQQQMTTAVNKIRSDAFEVDDTDGQDTVLNNSDTATDDNNEQTFCEEGE